MKNSELGLANAVTEATGKAVAAAPFASQDLKGSLIIYCAGCMLEVNRGGKMPKVAELLGQGLARKPFLGGFTFGEQGPTVPGDGGLNAHCNLMFNCCLFWPRKA